MSHGATHGLSKNEGIRLVTGLGNPGPKYDQTRHNAGFWFVDELARRHQASFQYEAKFMGEVCRVRVEDRSIWLLKPATYMNRSGQSVGMLVRFFRVPLEQVLVVHDEIDLPPGRSKIKCAGGHGGHNGLRDIIAHVGNEFWRLRLGVGHPGHRDQVIDYVLSRPGKEDAGLIRAGIDEAIDAMPWIAVGEMEKAMHRLHSKPENKA